MNPTEETNLMNRITDWWRRRFGPTTPPPADARLWISGPYSGTAPAVRPSLATATRFADQLMGRPGPDPDGYVDAFTDIARDVLAALIYAALVIEADADQVRQWANSYSLEPYELLAERVSGEAEDPDARTACNPLLRVYRDMPDRSRAAVMVQVVGALGNTPR